MLRVIPTHDDVSIMRLPKKLSRRNTDIELPSDYEGCPDLGVICGVSKGAADRGFEQGQVVFFDMVLGREVTTDYGVYVFIHKDDVVAMVDIEDDDTDWLKEAQRAQGIR